MKKFIQLIQEILEDAFEKCGYSKNYGKVISSNRPDLCEFQCDGALSAAKEYKKAPFIIADEVVNVCKDNSCFEMIEVVKPGFINIKVSNNYLVDYCNNISKSYKFGCELEKDKMVIIDYGGPNIAKPLHVGHLRTAVIGESIKRIHKFFENNVLGDVHLGDWGLQMGLVIEEMRERHPEWPYFDEKFEGEYPIKSLFTISDLEDIYPCASAKSKYSDNSTQEEIDRANNFKERAQLSTVKWQNREKGYYELGRKIIEVSVEDLKRNYNNLNVEFDLWLGESDAQVYIPEMIKKLEDTGIIYESEGAMVVDVQEEGDKTEIVPCMIINSRGGTGYQATDLATILQREKDYHPDEIIYIVDKRQELHFTQVFRCAKKANLVNENAKLLFLGNGTMNGKDGKPFKTRNGGVMRLESLIQAVNDKVYQKITNTKDMSEDKALEISKVVGLGALKYADLSNQISKDYIFDIDKFTMFEGNTGPYILYTAVRINSIINKFLENNVLENREIKINDNELEKKILLLISKFNQILEEAYREKSPSKICTYMFDLADLFNKYYQNVRILDDDIDKLNSNISLIMLIRDVFETGVNLLGFTVPERM